MNAIIVDLPGFTPVATMRQLFEAMVRRTPAYARQCDLAPIERDGVFKGYCHRETDAMWIGFASGLRISDRLALQTQGACLPYASARVEP